MPRCQVILLALALVNLQACGHRRVAETRPPRPDIVLVSIDTLRADHLGAWGYQRSTSPFLDSLAREGTRFASTWAPTPWTLPSHATMLTGLLPHRHGATRAGLPIDPGVELLPEALSAAGYTTAGVVTSFFVSSRYGFDRGFEHFHDFGIADGSRETTQAPEAQEALNHALEWAATRDGEGPVFLFLHLYDPHYPYGAPSPWDEKFDPPSLDDLEYQGYTHYLYHPLQVRQLDHLTSQYDEEIAYVDHSLAEFVEGWRSLRPATVFVITSDHGEELGERGSWGHAHTLYPEQLRVPWIVQGRDILRQTVDARVGLEDLAPTLAGLAGGRLAAAIGIDRSSRLLSGRPNGHRGAAVLASTSRFGSLLHRWHEPPFDLVHDLRISRWELYDLSVDASAHHDLAASEGTTVTEMGRRLYRHLGEPWLATVTALLRSDGVFVVGGEARGQELEVGPGSRFALFPLDAEVTLTMPEGETLGPFTALAEGRPKAGAGVEWRGIEYGGDDFSLTQEQRQKLRALGYLN